VTIARLQPGETFATGTLAAKEVLRELEMLCDACGVAVDSGGALSACQDAGLIEPTAKLGGAPPSPDEKARAKKDWTQERAKSVAEELDRRVTRVATLRQRALKNAVDYLIGAKMDARWS
jgi:hypothetical protein